MSDLGITNSNNFTVTNPASRDTLGNISAPRGIGLDKFRPNIETLTKFETKCIQIQLSNVESNINANLMTLGVPQLGPFKANINANTVVSYANTYFANLATISITNSDHKDILLGMVANIRNPSVGSFGGNTMVIKKSVGGNITSGNFVPGFTYTITSIGTTNFTLFGLPGNVANVVIGNVFVANAAGNGTGTAFLTNNQIMLGSNHSLSGDVTFTLAPLKLGKYQTSEWLLKKNGYKNDDGTWTGKNGVDSNEVFVAAPEVQDAILNDFFQEQYVELIKSGAIRDGDSKETIAGMLALSYQYQDLGNPQLNQSPFNPDKTINLENYSIGTKSNVWRNTGQPLDSQGRPGHIYFNSGRYAISTLGKDVPE